MFIKTSSSSSSQGFPSSCPLPEPVLAPSRRIEDGNTAFPFAKLVCKKVSSVQSWPTGSSYPEVPFDTPIPCCLPTLPHLATPGIAPRCFVLLREQLQQVINIKTHYQGQLARPGLGAGAWSAQTIQCTPNKKTHNVVRKPKSNRNNNIECP